MKSAKTIVVAGSSGLIGKAIVKYLENREYHIIRSDIADKISSNFINVECPLTVKNLFAMHKISGFINCAYPRNFQEHCELYMNANNNFAYQFSLNGGGSIVNFASIYGIVGPDDRIYKDNSIYMPDWYSGAKGAIIAHSRCMATRYGHKQVRVNCIALGGVYDNQPKEFVEKYNNRVPMHRMARTDDIYPLVEYLISDKSKYMTGQCIALDGGLSSW